MKNNGIRMKAFSVVELLTVVTLTGLLISIAVPAYDYIINRKQLQTATQDLYAYLTLAHSESLKRQVAFYVSFSGGSNWCYGLSDTANCDCAVANNCKVNGVETVKKSTDYKNISITATGFSGGVKPYVQYEGLRGVASSAGSINLTLNDLSTTINSNKIGLATICSDQLASYISCTNP